GALVDRVLQPGRVRGAVPAGDSDIPGDAPVVKRGEGTRLADRSGLPARTARRQSGGYGGNRQRPDDEVCFHLTTPCVVISHGPPLHSQEDPQRGSPPAISHPDARAVRLLSLPCLFLVVVKNLDILRSRVRPAKADSPVDRMLYCPARPGCGGCCSRGDQHRTRLPISGRAASPPGRAAPRFWSAGRAGPLGRRRAHRQFRGRAAGGARRELDRALRARGSGDDDGADNRAPGQQATRLYRGRPGRCPAWAGWERCWRRGLVVMLVARAAAAWPLLRETAGL